MICQDCIDKKHDDCKGKTHCDCQHRESEILADGTVAPVGVRRDVR